MLISHRSLFKNVSIVPKGNFLNLRRVFVIYPFMQKVLLTFFLTVLIVLVLLFWNTKHNLGFRCHVYFESVHLESLYQALAFLKQQNVFYKDEDILMETVPQDLLDFSDNKGVHDIENSNESLWKSHKPLHSHNLTSQETMSIPHKVTSEEINITPGERTEPVETFRDNYGGKLAFACLFSTQKFG